MARPGFLRRILRAPGTASLATAERMVRAARAPDPQGDAAFLALAAGVASDALGLAPHDNQLVAAAAMLEGTTVELDTGEGKTLVGAIVAAGLARRGRSVHVLSVNDYLAARDAAWMAPLFRALGVSVAAVTADADPAERRAAYRHDVVYAPVREVGFDVLRDRFVLDPAERVDPVLDAAVVDEADAVLIDDAMVPLVLAGEFGDHAADVAEADRVAAMLREGEHVEADQERMNVSLTDAGIDLAEAVTGVQLYTAEHADLLSRITLAAHARVLLRRDVEYVVDGGGVRLVDAARGRVAALQRWPDGLHAAVEAKEGLPITPAGSVMDSITIGRLLDGYRTVVGMSGSVLDVADQLAEFSSLRTARVERNVPTARVDHAERVFATEAEKEAALVAEVAARHAVGQPVLVGTQSVAESERVAGLLAAAGVGSLVLNARDDAAEAAVIAAAGERGAVTVSTQMAGRGTDIRLGGADEAGRADVVALGGLAVVSAARYPSARLDAQLRGRAGRQADPGESLGFESLEGELVSQLLTPAEVRRARGGSAAADAAQRIAEGRRRDRHRATIEYGDVPERQRSAVLRRRAEIESEPPGDARDTALLVLDECWREHLAMLQELRDGIHLRALAGQQPARAFQMEALRSFEGFWERFDVRRGRALADPDAAEANRRRRPSATWTYLVTDDPIGAPGDRLARGLARRLRPGS